MPNNKKNIQRKCFMFIYPLKTISTITHSINWSFIFAISATLKVAKSQLKLIIWNNKKYIDYNWWYHLPAAKIVLGTFICIYLVYLQMLFSTVFFNYPKSSKDHRLQNMCISFKYDPVVRIEFIPIIDAVS